MKIGTALAALALAGVLAASALSAPAAKKGALVKLHTTGLGKVLVDARGRTLYLFEADKGKRSVCYGKCAVAWPPLLTAAECDELIALYPDQARFRSRVDMARFRFGEGEIGRAHV